MDAYWLAEDVFFSQLTVMETLQLAAKLQLGDEFHEEEKEDKVMQLVRKLGLSSGKTMLSFFILHSSRFPSY